MFYAIAQYTVTWPTVHYNVSEYMG